MRREGPARLESRQSHRGAEVGRIHPGGEGEVRVQLGAGLGDALLAQARPGQGLAGPGQLHPFSRRVERGGQGALRAGFPVPREELPPNQADAAGQEYSGLGEILLQLEEDQDKNKSDGSASQVGAL